MEPQVLLELKAQREQLALTVQTELTAQLVQQVRREPQAQQDLLVLLEPPEPKVQPVRQER